MLSKHLMMVFLLMASTELYLCQNENTPSLSEAVAAVITQDIIGLLEGFGIIVPSIDELLELPLLALVGIPELTLFNIANDLCELIIGTNSTHPLVTPDINNMNLVLQTPCVNVSVPLLEAENLWNSSLFVPENPTVIVMNGWTRNINRSELIRLTSNAFNCRGGYNFIGLDASFYIDTFYTWAAFNTKQIGRNLAVALTKLSEITPIENVHLIGHSMGAQIAGYAGKFYTEMTGVVLSHITGLDPAKPCYNEGTNLPTIEKGVAQFVDIIHSSPGMIAKGRPLGDVDYYPSGFSPIQPGCFDEICDHDRSFKFYAESIYPNNTNNFLATRCFSLYEVEHGLCNGPSIRMGFEVPRNITGSYFSKVNAQEPFGKNAGPNFTPSNSTCGMCSL